MLSILAVQFWFRPRVCEWLAPLDSNGGIGLLSGVHEGEELDLASVGKRKSMAEVGVKSKIVVRWCSANKDIV